MNLNWLQPKKTVCGNWKKYSLAGPDFFLWFLFNCAPQILYSLVDLTTSLGMAKMCSILCMYPQTILSPVFSAYGFRKNNVGGLSLSKNVTWVTCFFTFLGYCASFAVIWDTVQDFPNSRKDHQLLIELIPIKLFFACFLIVLVLHLPCLQTHEEKVLEDVQDIETLNEEISLNKFKGRTILRSISI